MIWKWAEMNFWRTLVLHIQHVIINLPGEHSSSKHSRDSEAPIVPKINLDIVKQLEEEKDDEASEEEEKEHVAEV